MKKFLLIAIILLAALLRFWKLDAYPAFNADEAAIGYNAYSLIETGKDEHGNPWPVHFQSFNDYKPGLYVYVTLPFVKVLGLNEWAVRIPGAALGVLTVLVVYLLTKELFGKEKLSLAAGLFLAISPWHIHFSRGGWEVNAGTFFIAAGLLFFLKALKKPKLLAFSFLLFALSLYTYHAARIIVPILGLGLLVIHRRDLIKNLKTVIIASVLGAVLLIPLARDLLGPAGVSRAAGVGLFADQGPFNRVNEQRGEHNDFTGPFAKLLHNKPVNYGLAFVQNWAEHYHGEFLFLSGDDIQRNKVPETGQMYLFDILFFAVGLIFILKNYSSVPKSYGIVLWWLLIAPIAAALTFQSPHALRAHNMVIPLMMVSTLGFLDIVEWIKKFKNKRLVSALYFLLLALIAWQFVRYEHIYWVHMAKEYPFSSQYGVKELVAYLEGEGVDKSKKVMVTDRYDQPYILFLFYLKYDPAGFQAGHVLTPRDQFGFSTVRNFGKYTFTSITNWDSTRQEYRDALIAGTDEEIFEGTNVVKDIYGTNGHKYFQVVAN